MLLDAAGCCLLIEGAGGFCRILSVAAELYPNPGRSVDQLNCTLLFGLEV